MKWAKTVVALGFLASSIDAARAVEVVRPLPLPDGGLGSSARGILMTEGVGDDFAAGSQNDASRLAQPTVWQINDQTPADWNEFRLPLLAGTDQGAVVGGRSFQNGDQAAVGVCGPAEARHAVLWRKPAGAPFDSAARLSPNATVSNVAYLDGKGADVAVEELICVGTETTGDVTRPVIHLVDAASVTTTVLPTPSDRGGAALGWLGSNDALGAAICGYTLGADGRREPCVWRRQGASFVHVPVPLPKRHAGEIRAFASRERFGIPGDWLAGEAVTPKGATLGVVLEFGGDTTEGTGIRRRAPLPPLPGFVHSSAHGFIGGSDDVVGIRKSVPLAFGVSFDAGGDPVATVWIRGPNGSWSPIPARAILVASDEYFSFRRFEAGRGGLFGQVVPSSDAAPQGVVFARTGDHLPDLVQISAGKALGKTPLADLTRLWRADGRTLVVQPKGAGDKRVAAVDATYSSVFTTQNPSDRLGGYVVRAAAKAAAAGAAGTLDVKAYQPATKTWRTVGTHALTDAQQTFGGGFGGDLTDLVDASSADLRLRVEFRPTTNAKALTLDLDVLAVTAAH